MSSGRFAICGYGGGGTVVVGFAVINGSLDIFLLLWFIAFHGIVNLDSVQEEDL